MDPWLGVNILDQKVRQALRLGCRCGPTHSFQTGTSAECGERKERKIKKENPRWCFSRYLLEIFKRAEYLQFQGYITATRHKGQWISEGFISPLLQL